MLITAGFIIKKKYQKYPDIIENLQKYHIWPTVQKLV